MLTTTLNLYELDPRAQEALRTGWLSDPSGSPSKKRVIARKVLEGLDSQRAIVFETVDIEKRPPGIGPWLKAIRAFSLTATVTPCLAVLIWSLAQRAAMNTLRGALAVIGVCCLQIAINLLNDVEDYRRLIDVSGNLGGSGVIQSGWWTPAQLKMQAWFTLAIGTLLGLPAVISQPTLLIPIGIMGGLGVLLYSAPVKGLKYRALGDLAVLLLCGPALTIGFSMALIGTVSPAVVAIGFYFGFLAMGLLHINNLQDMKLDASHGVDTLAIRLGFKGSLRFLNFLYLAAIFSAAAGVLFWGMSKTSLLGPVVVAITCGPWLFAINQALGPESSQLTNCRIKAAQIHLISGYALIVGLAVSIFMGA